MAFLSKAQRQRYGCYVEEPTPAQLPRYFHLDDRDQGHIHINMLGRFFFDLPESIHLGAMRSLRSISDFNEKFT